MTQPITDPNLIAQLEAKAKTPVSPEMSSLLDAQLLRQAKQQAADQAGQFHKSMMTSVGVPLAQAGLGAATGGLSVPIQMLVGGGAELAAQKMGYAPESTTQVGLAAAIPAVGPLVMKTAKGAAKAISKAVAPAATRTAGVEAAVDSLGEIPDVIKRVKTPSASKQLYTQVEQTFTEVPTNVANRGITSALAKIPKSSDSPAARKYLKTLSDTLDAEATLPYENMAAEIQGMRTKAVEFARGGDIAGAKAVRVARQKIIEEMDKVSPDLAKANALYKRERSISKIEDALTKPRADIAFKNLVKNDSLVADMPEADLRMVEKIAGQLTKIGGSASPYSGLGGRFVDLVATPIAGMIESPTGRAFMRKMFQDGEKVSPAAISTALQFWRAYQAQNQGQ